MRRFIFVVSGALALLLSVYCAHGQSRGLTERPQVGPYFDQKLPPQAPVLSGNWSPVVAFPNLIFQNPVGLTPVPGTNRLAVWQREGKVYSFENNPATSAKTLVLDVSANCQGWDDSGLLGLAFHPDFVNNRYVYIWYNYVPTGTVIGNSTTRPATFTPTRNRLSRFTLDANGVALPGPEFIVLDQADVSVWHNGGGMFFHPVNGFLYITNGDDAQTQNTQKINTSLFSGVLRIDVDKRGGTISHPPVRRATNEMSPNWPQYFIPNDNPFVGVPNVLEEFFAIGLRSPHRMTLDPVTNRIFIGDVGAGSREEITVIEPSDPAGLNLQWSTIEGLNGNLTGNYIGVSKPPIIDYGRSDGACVVGGYVYRGQQFAADLGGRYIFGDNISNRIWVLNETTQPPTKTLLTTMPRGDGDNSGNDYIGLSSFGVDAQGELYMCQMGNRAGRIYKLQRGGTPSQPLPTTLSSIGIFSDMATLAPSPKLIPYGLNAPFWSDSAVKTRWAVIPDATTVGFAPTGEWTFPAGSVFVKHFELPVDDNNPEVLRRLETRLLVKMTSGSVYGATYKWRANGLDADLLEGGLTENVPIAITPLGALTGVDVGGPAMAGSTVRTGDAVTIQAGGVDIWNQSDQFHFAHQDRTGDFDIAVRVESVTQANLYTKAGLMARESLAAGSRNVMALVFPSNAARNNNVGGYEFQYRASTGGSTTALYPPAPQATVSYPNTWLRMKREGNTFISYHGRDSLVWTEFARTTLALPQTVKFGLAVTSHTATATTTAKFHLQSARIQQWYYPGRQDCISCHTDVSGGVLGPKTRQLNKDLVYPNGVTDNQIRAWTHVGLFANGPAEGNIPGFDRMAHHTDLSASLEKRAKSYLDANCANCHRPGGVQAFWDGRYDTPLGQQGIIYGQVTNDLGTPGSRVVVPQELARSILHHRVNTVGLNQMPPIARNQIDRAGVDMLAAWIASVAPNPAPSVTLTSPAPNSTIERPHVKLTATAADPDGIQKVEFYAGTTKIGEDTTAPYELDWRTAPKGLVALKAIASDTFGSNADSAPVTVTFINPPTTFAPMINFQLGSAPVPAGYLKDDGSLYGSRGNGYTYGWNRNNTPDARDRNLASSPDQRYDTLVHMQKVHTSGSNTSFWEISVPNGIYDVRAVMGDPSTPDGYQELQVEGRTFLSKDNTAAELFVDSTTTVEVTDGRLTLRPGPNATESRICFAEITRLPLAPSVSLTGTQNGAAFLNTDVITLGASASDADGSIVRVEFYDGSRLLGQDVSAPYAWLPTGLAPGPHQLRAVAYDNEGRITSSAQINVIVHPLQLETLGTETSGTSGVSIRLGTTLPPGRSYEIQWTSDFVAWETVRTGVSDGLPMEFVDAPGPNVTGRYYRMRVQP